MTITEKAKAQLEQRVNRLENFIDDQRRSLSNVKFTQRETNIALLVGGVLVAAGVAIWLLSDQDED